MRLPTRAVSVLAIATAITLTGTSAMAAGSAISNSGFEDGELTNVDNLFRTEDPVIPGWNWIDGEEEYVDLGNTQIAGCTTVDTSTYSASVLREYDEQKEIRQFLLWDKDEANAIASVEFGDHALVTLFGEQVTISGHKLVWSFVEDTFSIIVEDDEILPDGLIPNYSWYDAFGPEANAEFDALDERVPAPETRKDDVIAEYFDSNNGDEYISSVAVVDGKSLGEFETYTNDANEVISFDRSGKITVLTSEADMDDYPGYIAHGPVLYSDEFESGPGRQISIDWAASGDRDDYHVFAYLLNVDTCEQTEIIDETGEARGWGTTSVAIEESGTYRFVFVGGSYDRNWGGGTGALLFVDNIVEEVEGASDSDGGLPETGAGISSLTPILGLALIALSFAAFRVRRRTI